CFASTASASPRKIADSRLHAFDRGKFVLTTESAPKSVKLHRIEEMTYDATSVADATDLDAPQTFTLIGTVKACRVDSSKRAFISIWGRRPAVVANVLDTTACPKGDVVFAVDGDTDATADGFSATEKLASATLAAWAERVTGKSATDAYDQN